MSTERPHPPVLALWLLRRLCPGRNREALTGDLLERFYEGRSSRWFWRQVLAAILVDAVSQFRSRGVEVCCAVAGTALIWCVPWGRVVPTATISPAMDWGAQWRWLVVVEVMTTLLLLPLLIIFLRLWRTWDWANLLRVFLLCALLFTAGDLLTIWWCVNHPVMSREQGAWAVALQLGWAFAVLLISGREARRLASAHIVTPA